MKPYKPSNADIIAMRAFAEGVASKEQQIRAFDLIVNQLCGFGASGYSPSKPDSYTIYLAGRRDIAIEIQAIAVAKTNKGIEQNDGIKRR